jgi:hypothetical protein
MSPRAAKILTVNGRLGTMVVGNGVQVSYIVALINVLLALVTSFGVNITAEQVAYITTAVNLLLLIGARYVHQAALQAGRVVTAPPPVEK